MSDVFTPIPTENGTETASREVKTIPTQIGTGPKWNAPTWVITELIARINAKNPKIVRETLGDIMTGKPAE